MNYRNGNFAKLPNHEKREVIAFIAKLRIVPIEDPIIAIDGRFKTIMTLVLITQETL